MFDTANPDPGGLAVGEACKPGCAESAPGRLATRIHAVWTRDLDGTERFGRVNVALQVRAALREAGATEDFRLNNVFEERQRARSLAAAVMALAGGIVSGRLLPLQCSLFAPAARRAALLATVRDGDVVYLDGIRTLLLLRQLRRVAPGARIVVDLDDLMSRRYAFVSRHKLPLSLGYLDRRLPKAVSRLAAGRLARLVLWYERHALRRAEQEILRTADVVVLLNREEARVLAETAVRGARAEIVAIPPPAEMRPRREAAGETAPAWRAIFVGSDVLVQNRMTIAHLLDLWSEFRIGTELWIYGRQKTAWRDVPNVRFVGYVDDIADAYSPGSFMVYPCLVPGGIKTKVLEAFGHGVPVVGNQATFEGILPAGYELVIDDTAALVALLKNPQAWTDEFMRAAAIGAAYLQQEHTVRGFAERWRRAVLGSV